MDSLKEKYEGLICAISRAVIGHLEADKPKVPTPSEIEAARFDAYWKTRRECSPAPTEWGRAIAEHAWNAALSGKEGQ